MAKLIMVKYVFYRLLVIIPTLLIISLAVFYLGALSPGSPIDKYCDYDDTAFKNEVDRLRACQSAASNLGLDKPKFYFRVTQKAFSQDFYTVLNKTKQDFMEVLILKYGNSSDVINYYSSILQFKNGISNLPETDQIIATRNLVNQLLLDTDGPLILYHFEKIKSDMDDFVIDDNVHTQFESVVSSYGQMVSNQSLVNLWIPKFMWYGVDNQYHQWMSNFIKGDFGKSYFDNRKVSKRIKEALSWTLLMNLIAIFIAYLLSIPIGVYSAAYKNSMFDKMVTILLFLLHSLPVFWVATLLIVFFTTSEYGEWTDIFPTSGLSDLSLDAPFWDRFWDTAYHLILPIFCITYTSFAFISRQMRNGMLNVFGQQYMLTAKAKGLAPKSIIWKHGFKNGIFPLISMLASIFPAALSGSVIVEIIFGIPGMGRLAYDGILNQDWPVVNAILMLSAFLTIFGQLVADILYRFFDPRVQF